MKGAQSLRTRDFGRILYSAPTTCTSTIFVRLIVRLIRIRNARRGQPYRYDCPTRTALGGAVGRAGRHASRFIDTSLFNERRASNTELTGTNRAKKSRHRSKLRIKLRNRTFGLKFGRNGSVVPNRCAHVGRRLSLVSSAHSVDTTPVHALACSTSTSCLPPGTPDYY